MSDVHILAIDLAKASNTAVVFVGHVTKAGTLAGPKIIEHIVDTVVYFEGDRFHAHRIVRCVKNRFGSTNEIGIFEMASTGLAEVKNPSELFLQERPEGASGSVVVPALEGTRPLMVEIQALTAPNGGFGAARRPVQALPIQETGRLATQALRQLDVGRFIVVGHSMGCLTGVEMALADPAAVRSLVLLGPSTNSRERTLQIQRRRLIQDTLWEPPKVAWTAAGDYLRCGRRWYYANAAHMIAYRLEERLPLVCVPIILVRGEHDPIAPRSWLAELAAAGSAAVVAEVPGEAHAVMYRSPVAVAQHCLELAARS